MKYLLLLAALTACENTADIASAQFRRGSGSVWCGMAHDGVAVCTDSRDQSWVCFGTNGGQVACIEAKSPLGIP